jgi:hypothetical protein
MARAILGCGCLLLFLVPSPTWAQPTLPEEYIGDWVCQTFTPGYNILPPHADTSQPQSGRITTPATVQILKFALKTDGTYATANANGRFAFNAATNVIAWLDGPHQSQFSDAQLGQRDNGAPKLEFLANKRRYGCFNTKRR